MREQQREGQQVPLPRFLNSRRASDVAGDFCVDEKGTVRRVVRWAHGDSSDDRAGQATPRRTRCRPSSSAVVRNVAVVTAVRAVGSDVRPDGQIALGARRGRPWAPAERRSRCVRETILQAMSFAALEQLSVALSDGELLPPEPVAGGNDACGSVTADGGGPVTKLTRKSAHSGDSQSGSTPRYSLSLRALVRECDGRFPRTRWVSRTRRLCSSGRRKSIP
jgi:hypothetical protein